MTFTANYHRFWVTVVHFSTARLVGHFCSAVYRHELVKRINQDYSLSSKWHKVTIEQNGTVRIVDKDGKTEIVNPPKAE